MASYIYPAETSRHAGTIMTWPTTASIITPKWTYLGADVQATREELARIVLAIAKYEPVRLFVRDPKTYDQNGDAGLDDAQRLLGKAANVTIHITPNADSLWARDNGAVFVRTADESLVENSWHEHDDPGFGLERVNTSSRVVGMLLGFNQWGRKLPPSPESYLAATACQSLEISAVLAPFIGEGGGIEMDGEGTMLATEASLLNPNRNPGMDKATFEKHFAYCFGVKKTIWIPGVRGYDITDDHIDALARFSGRPGVVLLSRPFVPDNADAIEVGEILSGYMEAKEIIEGATDAKGRRLTTVAVQEPDPAKVLGVGYHPESGPSVAYVNFLIVNGAVIMARFGDNAADANAAKIVGDHFPGRVIEQVSLHQLLMQGGGIHCATQQYYTE